MKLDSFEFGIVFLFAEPEYTVSLACCTTDIRNELIIAIAILPDDQVTISQVLDAYILGSELHVLASLNDLLKVI
jgi:hypothetical protein